MLRLLLTALLLTTVGAGAAQPVQDAAAPVGLSVSATPVWKGWSRPGRTSELDIRVGAGHDTRARLDVVSGVQARRSDLALQSGRPTLIHLAVPAAASIDVTVAGAPAGLAAQRLAIELKLSESPLLGVALADGQTVSLPGFHSVTVGAPDLPTHAQAHGSVDALIIDAPSLRALDAEQLDALLQHVAACGRVALVEPGAPLRAALVGAGGCGGHALLLAESVDDARERLAASLAVSLPSALPPGTAGELVRPDASMWQQVTLLLAVYAAASIATLLFSTRLPWLLAVPMLMTAAALALLHAQAPVSRLIVWSEGESGTRVLRYQAWERIQGVWPGHASVPIPAQLSTSVQPCDPAQPMRLQVDAERGRATAAEFDTGLFRATLLCFAGSFPLGRALVAAPVSDSALAVRNVGAAAWPEGRLMASGLVYPLPAVAVGASAMLSAGQAPSDAPTRLARSRMSGSVAALWPFDLSGLANAPPGSAGWLLLSAPAP